MTITTLLGTIHSLKFDSNDSELTGNQKTATYKNMSHSIRSFSQPWFSFDLLGSGSLKTLNYSASGSRKVVTCWFRIVAKKLSLNQKLETQTVIAVLPKHPLLIEHIKYAHSLMSGLSILSSIFSHQQTQQNKILCRSLRATKTLRGGTFRLWDVNNNVEIAKLFSACEWKNMLPAVKWETAASELKIQMGPSWCLNGIRSNKGREGVPGWN